MTPFQRITLCFAGLAGAWGVGAAALSAHGGYKMGAVALVALTHAVLLVTLGLAAPKTGIFKFATILVMAGMVLFCGDLALRAMTGSSLVGLAAPTGAIAMMVGWLTLVVAAMTHTRKSEIQS